MPVDPIYVALALLIAGVVASVVPLVPGSLLSAVGIVYYYVQTGTPGTIALVGLLSICLLALLLDWLGSALAARVGGASLRTTAIAAIVGILLLPLFGPIGLVVGIFATVFLVEYHRSGTASGSFRTAGYAAVGTLVSAGMQVVLLISVLVAFVLLA